MNRWLLPRIAGASMVALVVSAPSHAEPPPGDYTFKVTHGDRARSYILHVPRDAVTSPWPVVINFHGAGSSAAGQQAYSRMDAVADREGFLVVYPNGTGGIADRLLSWNAGPCCGYAARQQVDDVGFVRALVDDLETHAQIDRARIYATGLSNGAMMAYRLAADAPDLVAAIAPVAGALALQIEPKRAIPILHIHSVDDTRALYNGGLGPPYPFTNIRVPHPSVEPLLLRWAEHNGCPTQASMEPPIHGHGGSSAHTATRIAYSPCRDGVEVVLWKLTGAGHVWPGAAPDYLGKVLGSQSKVLGSATDVIDANEQMWQFFALYHTMTSTPE
jgi:polyhydroxybutyrate depolymerase